MKITTQNKQIWQNLFEAAITFRDQKSWTWLEDRDLFGIKDPNSDLIGYCCIMGRLGEVFAIGVYLGDKGFQSYVDLATCYDKEHLDQMSIALEQYMLKVEFVNNEETDKRDKATYKALGLKFRGKNQYVQIREMLPGLFPWHINEEQAVFLTHVLKQATEVVGRAKDNPFLIQSLEGLLIRIPQKQDNEIIWSDSYQPEPEYKEEDMADRKINPFLLNKIKGLEKKEAALCFSFFYMPTPVKQGKERPIYSKVMMWIDFTSVMILGAEAVPSNISLDVIDQAFIQQFEKLGYLPSQILVNTQMAEDIAYPIVNALDIELVFAPEEEAFEACNAILNSPLF